jgi:class 3 adenylate cyclase
MALARVLCPDLIGRDVELSILEDALLDTLRGDGRVVILGGEAGMGKTRLVNELTLRARRLNCVVMAGACSEADLSLPYLPFLEAVGNHLATENLPKLRERLGPAADELAHLFPQMGRPSPSGDDATQAKLRLFESILLVLRDAAGSRALLLVLEDLQWSDPATRELLDYATRRLRSANVLILATYRTDEMHRKHALLPTIEGWRRSGQAELVELKALPSSAVADMVCAIFEEPQVSEEFRDFLRDRSEGNPFVLEEMLRDALDRGDIFKTDTGWDRKALGEMRIPRTVRDTILHRIERLSREEVAVLSAASVVGRSFDLATLSAVTGIPEASVLEALEACVSFQLVEEEDRNSAKYRFRHALTREAVYEDMVVPRRQMLHARVAEVLGSRANRASVDMAHHLLMAGRYDQAVVMCIEAADDAIRGRAYGDAAALLERAAPHVRDPVERGRLMCRAGEAYWNNAESGAARRLLEEGIANLDAAGLSLEAARHRITLGRCFWELLRSDLAREQFERARDDLEKAGPSEDLAIAYIRLSGLKSFDRGGGAGLDDAVRAAAIAEEVGATMALAWAWGFMALAEMGLGQVRVAFKHLDDSYRAAIAGDYRFQADNAVYNAAWLAISLGDGTKAEEWKQRMDRSADTASGWMPYIKGLVTLHQGRVAEAIDLARVAIQRTRESGHQKMAWRSSVLLAHTLAENMRLDEAVTELPPLSSRVEGQDVIYDATARVRLSLAQGDLEAAFADAQTVKPEAVGDIASPADAVAEAAGADPAWLRSFLDSLQTTGEMLESPRIISARGRLALYEGRIDDALRELGRAEADFAGGGLLLDVWHVGPALAEAQARSGDVAGARTRLLSIVAAAHASGARLAAKLALETGTRLGLEMGVAPEAAAPAPDSSRVATGERMVSVLFADVRGYTAMSGRSAPSDTLDRIASLQRWASQEVARRNGQVDKFAGDSIMATFNISGRSVDHALQALQAAIAIIDKAALAGLPVGAGIAVGPAVVGRLARSANVSVLGEVTNLAARLQAQSPAGEVTLSEEAHKRVQEWLADRRMTSERIEVRLKGFDEPVVAYRVGAGVAASSGG